MIWRWPAACSSHLRSGGLAQITTRPGCRPASSASTAAWRKASQSPPPVSARLREEARRLREDPDAIEDIARRLFESIPPSLRAAQHDLETNFRSVLRATLSRLDLTTREEFDAQSRVLARTREKVAALEAKLVELEARSK